MMTYRIRKDRGFTLIELVIVMAIIGLMAVAVLPRFVSLAGDARTARLNAALGSMRSAAVIAHGTWLARNLGTPVTITAEGGTITLVNGYPTADAGGIVSAAQLTVPTDFTLVGGGAAAGNTVTVQVTGATALATCQFTYTNPAVLGNPPTFSVPVTTGC